VLLVITMIIFVVVATSAHLAGRFAH
jgi:hypothetical protein